jgi:hypothetical protein
MIIFQCTQNYQLINGNYIYIVTWNTQINIGIQHDSITY